MTATLNSAFDTFLFTPIADDAAGTPLTVLSTLARLDLDPWEEAATLFNLSQDSATERLASLLAVPASTASRLIKLLHHTPAKRDRAAPAEKPAGTPETPGKRVGMSIYYLLAVIFMLIGLWAMAAAHSQSPAESVPAPAAHAS